MSDALGHLQGGRLGELELSWPDRKLVLRARLEDAALAIGSSSRLDYTSGELRYDGDVLELS
ncbi:MAG TPA: hypothetical protein VLA98_12950, partial [Solirubrobacteraceae bacterium]|nr:hypothetical protein [Solirubrobacteraceae bacterium]